jgi:O-antigen/teichoic acid export membrane protein
MFQALVGGLGAFVGVGIAAGVARKHYDTGITPEGLRRFNAASLQLLLASAIVSFVILTIFGAALSGVLGLELSWMQYAVIVSASAVIVQVRLAEWQVRNRALAYGAFQVAQSVVNTLSSLLLVVGLAWGANGRIAGQAGSMVLFAGIGLALLWRDGLLAFFTWEPRELIQVATFGLPLMPHVLAAFVLFSVDRIVIKSELGLAEVGIYMVAVQLASGVSLVFDSISRAYMPWLFEHLQRDDPQEKRRVVRTTYKWFAVILAGAGCVFVVGPEAVALLAGERYAKAGNVIGWLILGQAFLGMYVLLSSYLIYGKRTGLLSAVTVFSAALYIGLLLLLVRSYGLHGAAIGFAAAMALRFLLTWRAAHVSHPMPWIPKRHTA